MSGAPYEGTTKLIWAVALAGSVAIHGAMLVSAPPRSVGEQPRPAGTAVSVAGTLAGVLGNTSVDTPVPEAQPQPTEVVEPTVPRSAAQSPLVTPSETAPVGAVAPLTATQVTEAPVAAHVPEATPVEEAAQPQVTPADKVQPTQTAAVQDVKPPEAIKPEKIEKVEPPPKKPVKRVEKRKKRPKSASGGRSGGRTQGAAGNRQGGRGGARAASAGAVRSYGLTVRARILANRPSGSGGYGRAIIAFGVSSSGGLRYARIARSSGSRSLDQSALAAVRRSAPFPRPPSGASSGQLRFSISFSFR